MDIITLSEAKAKGLKKYFTGKPCKYGHIGPRIVASAECAECHNIRSRVRAKKWAHDNPERYQKNQKRWREENQARLSIYNAEYRATHSAGLKAKLRQKRESNPEHFANLRRKKMEKPGARERARQSVREAKAKKPHHYRQLDETYRERNRKRIAARIKAWMLCNPERAKEIHDAASHNRRARKHMAGKMSRGDIRKVRAAKVCAACGQSHPRMEIDHIVALSKGGTNHISNLQLLCRPCNRSKHTRDYEEWLVEKICRQATV